MITWKTVNEIKDKSVWIFKLKKKKNPKNSSFLVLQMSAITT